jgi:tetratricopeptide (TPR) repeat protein
MNQAYKEFSALMQKGEFQAAAAFAERQSLAAFDKSEFWLTRLSTAFREAGRDDDALAAAEKACALDPHNNWALLARAEALLKKGKFEEALESFGEAATDARTAPRAQKGLLTCLVEQKSWQRVLTYLAQSGMALQSAFPWRVRALMGLGKTIEAEAACDELLATAPDNSAALWKKTDFQIASEGIAAVAQRFARLAKIPGKPPIYGEINATLCKRTGKVESALVQYEKLSKGSGDPAVFRKQAFALAKSGHEDRAVPLMEELLRITPSDMFLHSAYLPACTRLKDLDRAWKFYHELLALHPEHKGLYGRLKKVQAAMEKIGKEQSP